MAVGAVAEVGAPPPPEGCPVVGELRAGEEELLSLLLLLPLLLAGDAPLRVAAGRTPAVLLLGIALGPAAGVEFALAGALCASVVGELRGVEVLLLLIGEELDVVVGRPEGEDVVLLLEVPVLCCMVGAITEVWVLSSAEDVVDDPSCVETPPVGRPPSVLADRLAVSLRAVEPAVSAALGVEGEEVVVVALLLSRPEDDTGAGRVLGPVGSTRPETDEVGVYDPVDMAVPLLEALAGGGRDAPVGKVEPALMFWVPGAGLDEVGLPLATTEIVTLVEDTAPVKVLDIGVLDADAVLGLVMFEGSSRVTETPRTRDIEPGTEALPEIVPAMVLMGVPDVGDDVRVLKFWCEVGPETLVPFRLVDEVIEAGLVEALTMLLSVPVGWDTDIVLVLLLRIIGVMVADIDEEPERILGAMEDVVLARMGEALAEIFVDMVGGGTASEVLMPPGGRTRVVCVETRAVAPLPLWLTSVEAEL